MNKNRGFTPLAVVLMLSGSLALTGCDDKQAQQGGQQMPAVGVVTVKTEPLQITTELPVAPVPTGSQKFVLKLAGLS
ncbi:acriflavin resistance protein A [Escherichia coli]|nr:acriflavin resistance protein A [Escherichia coli]